MKISLRTELRILEVVTALAVLAILYLAWPSLLGPKTPSPPTIPPYLLKPVTQDELKMHRAQHQLPPAQKVTLHGIK